MSTDPIYYEVCDVTWPSAEVREVGKWRIGVGLGGGKRVSAAKTRETVTQQDIHEMEEAQRALGQTPLVSIEEGQDALDQTLEAAGYEVIDAVNIYTINAADLLIGPPPRATMFNIWEPLQMQNNIWARGGIGADRLAVMDRADCAKTSILSRWDEKPAAAAYVGMHKGIAMLHALEVLAHQRKKGVGAWVMRTAAKWCVDIGGSELAVICTKHNIGANALYSSLGMRQVGEYHYRIKQNRD